jgi:hypothetical protein
MLLFEPVRRSVSKAFVSAHFGMSPQARDVNWADREEARLIHVVERERLYDVTREAALHGMSVVRDRARAQQIAETYPDEVMPDGRRIVVIAA